MLSLGLSYTTPQEVNRERVADFDGNGSLDGLKLQAPQQVGIGVAFELLDDRLVLAVDGKWGNWGNATGYEDFDWRDQWVAGVGAQFAVILKKLFVRAG